MESQQQIDSSSAVRQDWEISSQELGLDLMPPDKGMLDGEDTDDEMRP